MTRGIGIVAFAVVPAALLFGALAPDAWVLAVSEGGVACPLRALIGLRCPFCGMTHATLALGQGDLSGSFAYHPFALLVLGLWVAGSIELIRRRPRSWVHHRLAPVGLLAVVGLIWAVNIARPV